jgi:hypothetical protein
MKKMKNKLKLGEEQRIGLRKFKDGEQPPSLSP